MSKLTQYNRVIRWVPVTSAPYFTSSPYIFADVQVGDSPIASTVNPSGYPIPSTSALFAMSDATTRAYPYTFQSADVGLPATYTLTASSSINGTAYSASTTASPFTVIPAVTAPSQGLMGTNTTSIHDYTNAFYSNNAGQQGRGFWTTGSSPSNPVLITQLDANGWPLVAFQYLITSVLNGYDGQIPHGTYQCNFVVDPASGTKATTVTGNGCTISNITTTDNVTYNFTLTTPAGTIATLFFDGGVKWIGIPRSTSSPAPLPTGPEFSSDMLSSFARFSTMRTMDLSNILFCGDVNWSDRIPDKGITAPLFPYSWERILRMINAIVAYPGSNLKEVHFNIPGRSTAAYAASFASLASSILTPNVSLICEYANEPWNFSAPAQPGTDTRNFYQYYLGNAQTELQTIAGFLVNGNSNYGTTDGSQVTINNLASVVRASNTVTVTTTNALKPFVAAAIAAGKVPIINHQTDATWNAGYTNSSGTVYAPITNLTVTGSNSFTYTQTGADGSVATTAQMAFFFNPTSTLITDNLSYNMTDFIQKWYARASYQARNAWIAVRPQDKWLMNLQQYGPNNGYSGILGAMNSEPMAVRYGNWLSTSIGGNGLSDWCNALAIAPYTRLNFQFQSATASTNTLQGVPFASQMVAGDVISVAGVALSGGTATGAFSGTTLTLSGYTGNRIYAGQSFTWNSGANTASVTALGTSTGGNGTVTLSTSSVTLTSAACTSSAGATFTANVTAGGTMTVTSSVTGTALANGQTITATGLSATITAVNSSTSFTLSNGPAFSGVALTSTGSTITTSVDSGSGTTLTIADTINQSATFGKVAYISGDPAGICACWQANSNTYGLLAMMNHAYLCAKYGVSARAYEGGNESPSDDISLTTAQLTTLMQSSYTGTNMTNLLNNWFTSGMDAFEYFSFCPGWPYDPYNPILSWTDTTSPKAAAILTYNPVRSYGNINSNGSGFLLQAKYSLAGNFGISNANPSYPASSPSGGVIYWPTNSVTRYADWPIVVPRAGQYKLYLVACDSATGTTAQVYLDNFASLAGTIDVAGTGAGDSASSSPAASVGRLVLNFTTRGRHNVRISFPPTSGGTGVRPGIVNVVIVPAYQ